MSGHLPIAPMNRRDFLRLGPKAAALGLLAAAGRRNFLQPTLVAQAQGPENMHIAATDGWIHIDPSAVVPSGNVADPYHPDVMANRFPVTAPNLTTYIFGFRDVTGLSPTLVNAQKMRAQLGAPPIWLDENVPFTLKLTNLGLLVRPDLIDSHTIHFHGFRNAIPIFDGEPTSSVAVPIIRDLTYLYIGRYPGTYMYHCHFEETEHVHMGMVGPAAIRPAQNAGNLGLGIPPGKYAYNDEVQPSDPRSTTYDREFIIFLSEIWAFAHWCDSRVQLPEWSDYRPDFYLLNGRVWPDTLEANGQGTDPTTGDLIAPPGRPDLKYQPVSSLVTANSGERVLLRFINLGFMNVSMTLSGIKMRVVGKDATLLRSRTGHDLSYWANTVMIGAGESVDAIFIAPNVTTQTRFLLYNPSAARLNNAGRSGFGGQMTEVHIRPASGYPPQTAPNT
ncbi:MAG: multicopper oxidase domain-containing protein [Anaerolineae bacterium]